MNLFSEEMLNTFNASILPTNEACLLPREIYTSEEFFRFEKDAIFSREWLCAGRVDQVPNVGDYHCHNHLRRAAYCCPYQRRDPGHIGGLSASRHGPGRKRRELQSIYLSLSPLDLRPGWTLDRDAGNGPGSRLQ